MAIKVSMPIGYSSVSVAGLHQWDYGQVLEIESEDLPSIVEVHFACSGMTEAIVHTCSVAGNVAAVTIPNRCLEQSTAINAFVYEIDGTMGRTIKTITLPIIPRVRPAKTPEIPQEIVNRYTELITEIREAIDALKSGSVVVARAMNATSADYAATAGNASNATHAISSDSATSAGHATTADRATTATTAETANNVQRANYANSADYATEANRATRANYADSADSATTADSADSATSATYAEIASNGNIEKDLISWMMMVETKLMEMGVLEASDPGEV